MVQLGVERMRRPREEPTLVKFAKGVAHGVKTFFIKTFNYFGSLFG